MQFGTKLIHVGNKPDEKTGAVMPPIYMTSTYIQEEPGVPRGEYDYTRAGNPNFTALEELLASLEEAKYATVFSSGMGALTALVGGLLKSGDEVIGLDGLYGGTYRLFTQVFNQFGIKFSTIDSKDISKLKSVFLQKPKWLLFETPTNPLLNLFDIEELSTLAKEHGVFVVVDNTFATPYLQNPLSLGADVVWHSTTKYLSGHSDVIGGAIMTNSLEVKKRADFARKSLGVNPSPFDVWLINRGVKTLKIRMMQHEENACAIASFLKNHVKVKKVYYPGLKDHLDHALAKRQMRGFGGMVSAEFMLSKEEMFKLISSFKLFTLAESLGGVESLVNHPGSMTHASIPEKERERIGITDGLVRFSIGIEDKEDLIEDLRACLN